MKELYEYYNFALMTFDLEGQGQGQILKRLFFMKFMNFVTLFAPKPIPGVYLILGIQYFAQW